MDNDSVLPIVLKPDLPNPPWVEPSAGNEQGENSMSVYVRVRPLLEEEKMNGVGMMLGMTTTSSDPGDSSATALKTNKVEIGGFTGVLGTEADNQAMFQVSPGHSAEKVKCEVKIWQIIGMIEVYDNM